MLGSLGAARRRLLDVSDATAPGAPLDRDAGDLGERGHAGADLLQAVVAQRRMPGATAASAIASADARSTTGWRISDVTVMTS